jgi:hypothetical protein
MHARHRAWTAAVLLVVAGDAVAQQPATYTFRLAKSPSNVGVCNGLDSSMGRQHTVTVSGDRAEIRSSGGIDDTLKPGGPGVWKTDFELGRVRLVVVADLSKSPRTLVVTAPRDGCRWSGESP